MFGVCLRHPLLFHVGSFYFMWGDSYMLHAAVRYVFHLYALYYYMCGLSLTHPVVFVCGSLSYSYTPSAILCGEFVLQTLCCFMWGVCYTPCAILYREYVLHTLGNFIRKMCLTYPILFCVRSMSYRPSAILRGEFLFYVGSFLHAPCWSFLHAPCCFMWGVSPTYHMPFYMGSFSFMPVLFFCEEFLLHAPCCFLWGLSLIHPVLM